MTKIVGALLARNEATEDRYLKRVLANAFSFCDEVVVLDDGSTDATAEVCREAGASVTTQPGGGFWGGSDKQSEAPARKQLWKLASEAAGENGWLYLFDADHELQGISPREVRGLTRSTIATCFAFPLWDAWEKDTMHRVDGYWQAWANPRPWLFKALPVVGWNPVWQTRALHVGHFPANFPVIPGLAPLGAGILHLGYVSYAHRVAKQEKYLALA